MTAAADPPAPSPRVTAVGVGVADLDRAEDFYTRVLGMRRLMALTLPHMEEVVVGFGRGAAVALMQYTDGVERDYARSGTKVVVSVPDPAALAAAIRAEGLRVWREPAPVDDLGGAVVGFATDPDGHTVEILGQ